MPQHKDFTGNFEAFFNASRKSYWNGVREVGREREGKQRRGNNLVLPNEIVSRGNNLVLPNEMQLCRNLTSGFVILHDPYHLWHHCATSVSDGIFNNSFSGNLTDNLACLGKSGLTLRYLSLVVIESGLQNFCANSVWFLLHSVFLLQFSS